MTSPRRRVTVVTDSTSCLPTSLCQQWSIHVVPLTVAFGMEVFHDGVNLTPQEFYQRLFASETLPVTSQPSVGAFRAAYAPLVEAGLSVVSIHLSAGVSGTVSSAQSAAQEFPDADIRVVDSGAVSMGFGWAALAAAKAAAEGQDASAVERVAQDVLRRSRLYIMLDTLDYLYKGGRIGKASSLMGALLAIKPLITVDGPVVPLGKPRTRRAALEQLAQMARAAAPFEQVAVVYTHDPALAHRLRDLVADVFDPQQVLCVDAGVVLGTYAGPGAAGIAFVAQQAPPTRPTAQ
ncbi:MAG: DegV family protein [Chloroflexi bacterium]|nr:DegV family protein [Chloroflexota bacterium]